MLNTRLLMLIDISLILIILILICIFWEKILKYLNAKIEFTRIFIKNNEGFFSIFFILLFALEQIILILLTTYFRENADLLRLIISIFALVVITTASLQKFILETKRKYDNETRRSIEKSNAIIRTYKDIIQELIGILEEDKSKKK